MIKSRRHLASNYELADDVIDSELRLSRLDDPSYARSQGVSLLHFDVVDRSQFGSQPWLMVNKTWGAQSHTVVEPTRDIDLVKMLPDHCYNELKVSEYP
jgi:hypothetical protein